MGKLKKNVVDAPCRAQARLVRSVKKHLFRRREEPTEEMRSQSWIQIAEDVGMSVEASRILWLKICTTFLEEVWWTLKYKCEPVWLLYPQMEFLLDYLPLNTSPHVSHYRLFVSEAYVHLPRC